MSRRADLLVLLFFLLILFLFFYLSFGIIRGPGELGALPGGGDRIALVRITGPIYDSRDILDQLREVEDRNFKAILVRLDTPGGGVAASQEIYDRLAYLRDEKDVVIVASMGSVAASGGYYIALGADTIVANPGTTTGSIGVIAQFPYWGELMDKVGIGVQIIKSGEFKDTGNPYRTLGPAEREYLQAVINDIYRQFVATVAEERNMPVDSVELLADGRVYTGQQAHELGLVDVLGSRDEAARLAARMAGISGEPVLVETRRKKLTMLDLIFGDLEEMVYLRFGLAVPVKYEMPRNFR
ncbi:MAG: signal peptide peptidase SppA [Candidatus Zixiibacteriota bacterium]|nr:MAG: signal peptide peptidase SppA [candidate division Zixibacteria bacterium]